MRSPNQILVVMALQLEEQGVFEHAGVPVLFTGIGKVNAAYQLTKALQKQRFELVVNFGTAGSPRHSTGSVVACTRFLQRDMDVRGLGFELGQTPFEETPSSLEFAPTFKTSLTATCASADRFETLSQTMPYEVIDMEAYALAKVCHLEGLPFACAKYISDGADHNAASDWQASLPLAAREFFALYQQLLA